MHSAKWIIPLSCVPNLLAAGYAIFIFRKLKSELKVFTWFLFLSCIIQLSSLALWWFRINNLPLLHVYVAAGFFCLAWFYKTVLRDFIDRRVLLVVLILFLIFTIINSLFIQTLFTFNSYALTAESVLIIIFSFSTFILSLNEMVKDTDEAKFKSINWINSGLFIYYSSSLLLFYFGNTMQSFSTYVNQYSWIMLDCFSAIMYSCFFIGLWKRPAM
jgi:hypothetical protein